MKINLFNAGLLACSALVFKVSLDAEAFSRIHAKKVENVLSTHEDKTKDPNFSYPAMSSVDKLKLPYSNAGFDTNTIKGFINSAFVLTGEVPNIEEIPYALRISRLNTSRILNSYQSILKYLENDFDEPNQELKNNYYYLSTLVTSDSAVTKFVTINYGISESEFKSVLDLFGRQPGV